MFNVGDELAQTREAASCVWAGKGSGAPKGWGITMQC